MEETFFTNHGTCKAGNVQLAHILVIAIPLEPEPDPAIPLPLDIVLTPSQQRRQRRVPGPARIPHASINRERHAQEPVGVARAGIVNRESCDQLRGVIDDGGVNPVFAEYESGDFANPGDAAVAGDGDVCVEGVGSTGYW